MPLRTPLFNFHADHGGKMVDFAGWEMPIMYSAPGGAAGSIVEEHRQVRASGGLFDVSHMGRVKITGRHSRRFLERLCTRRISDMEPGPCRRVAPITDTPRATDCSPERSVSSPRGGVLPMSTDRRRRQSVPRGAEDTRRQVASINSHPCHRLPPWVIGVFVVRIAREPAPITEEP